jgi:diaminopimelate epimerase
MVNGRRLRVNFINTGVPHTVILSAGVDKINVPEIGRIIRYHKRFSPRGTNVNFMEILGKNAIKIRTYERGVEAETLACGTGSVACALILVLKTGVKGRVMVHTKGGEVLKVYFKREAHRFREVWLEGKAKIICKGVYYV